MAKHYCYAKNIGILKNPCTKINRHIKIFQWTWNCVKFCYRVKSLGEAFVGVGNQVGARSTMEQYGSPLFKESGNRFTFNKTQGNVKLLMHTKIKICIVCLRIWYCKSILLFFPFHCSLFFFNNLLGVLELLEPLWDNNAGFIATKQSAWDSSAVLS